MTTRPPKIKFLAEWATNERESLRDIGVDLAYRENSSEGGWSASVEGEGRQRFGYFSLWESGESDFQVLRRGDDLLVLNEHRLVRDEDELLDALTAFRLVLTYEDPRPERVA